MAHPLCSAADDLPESTNPSVACKNAQGSQHTMTRSVSWDQPTRRSPIDEKGTTLKQGGRKQRGHPKSMCRRSSGGYEKRIVLWYVKDDDD